MANINGALQGQMLSVVRSALMEVAEKAERHVEEALDRYYAEYRPRYYQRTYQLKNACRVRLRQEGNNFYFQIYLDVDSLNYSHRTNPFTGKQYVVDGWDAEKVVDSANNYLHGGYDAGTSTSIWDDPIDEFCMGEIQSLFAQYGLSSMGQVWYTKG